MREEVQEIPKLTTFVSHEWRDQRSAGDLSVLHMDS